MTTATPERLQCLECGSHTHDARCGTCLSYRLGPVDGPGGVWRNRGSRRFTPTSRPVDNRKHSYA